MTDQRMALLARLEQAAGSTEPDVVREALRWAIEELMEADVTDRLGAGPHERTPDRLGQRSGHRGRLFDSRAGALELAKATYDKAVSWICSDDAEHPSEARDRVFAVPAEGDGRGATSRLIRAGGQLSSGSSTLSPTSRLIAAGSAGSANVSTIPRPTAAASHP